MKIKLQFIIRRHSKKFMTMGFFIFSSLIWILRSSFVLNRRWHLFIWEALQDLVPFVQFKKRKKHPWTSVIFSKVASRSLGVFQDFKIVQMVPNRVNHHMCSHLCQSLFLNKVAGFQASSCFQLLKKNLTWRQQLQ